MYKTKIRKEIGMSKTNLSVKVIGENGNVFSILGRVSKELKHNGYHDMAVEMSGRVFKSESYDEALGIMQEYVEFK